VTYAVGLIKTM